MVQNQEMLEIEPKMTAEAALESFANYLGIKPKKINSFTRHGGSFLRLNDFPEFEPALKYIQSNNGLVLVWDLELDLDTNWFNVQVDAHNGNVVQLVDWVSHATFNVYPLGINDPTEGPRQKLVDPAHPQASPIGWNAQKPNPRAIKFFTKTMGNNVIAQDNPDGRGEWKSNHRPDGGKALDFDFELDLEEDPNKYTDAAIVNLFYLNNAIHDLFWVYGFNEIAGNFQDDNIGRGGKGNDAVIANAQDGSGTNNANCNFLLIL